VKRSRTQTSHADFRRFLQLLISHSFGSNKTNVATGCVLFREPVKAVVRSVAKCGLKFARLDTFIRACFTLIAGGALLTFDENKENP
jgi:hypothetical protein